VGLVSASPASAQAKKPNILVIFGDDIGYSNISAYNMGVMGYRTPNIDRVAQQGAIFTDYYAFLEQRARGLDVWRDPLIVLRVPLIEDLRADPYERAPIEASDYDHWMIDRVYLLVPAQALVGKFLMTFKEFPPRQSSATFGIDQVMQKLREGAQDNN